MEAIQSFASRVKGNFDKIGASVDGIATDLATLKKKIEDLQNSPGQFTPEDQAALDGIEGLATSLANRVTALDEATATAPTPNA